jgi:hypothetical protein
LEKVYTQFGMADVAILRNTVELCTTPFQVAYEYGRRGGIPVTSKQRHSSVWGGGWVAPFLWLFLVAMVIIIRLHFRVCINIHTHFESPVATGAHKR